MANPLVLLLEDSPDDEQLVHLALKRVDVNCDLEVVSDGERALARLAHDAAPSPSLMIFDLHLPGIDGFEVCRRVRQFDHLRLLPLVVLTASNSPSHAKRSYESGANSFVVKPNDPMEYLDRVMIILRYWLTANQSADLQRN